MLLPPFFHFIEDAFDFARILFVRVTLYTIYNIIDESQTPCLMLLCYI